MLITLLAVVGGRGTLRFNDSKGGLRCAPVQDRQFTQLSFFDSRGSGCAEMGAYLIGPALRLALDDSWNALWYGEPKAGFSIIFRDAGNSVVYAVPPR